MTEKDDGSGPAVPPGDPRDSGQEAAQGGGASGPPDEREGPGHSDDPVIQRMNEEWWARRKADLDRAEREAREHEQRQTLEEARFQQHLTQQPPTTDELPNQPPSTASPPTGPETSPASSGPSGPPENVPYGLEPTERSVLEYLQQETKPGEKPKTGVPTVVSGLQGLEGAGADTALTVAGPIRDEPAPPTLSAADVRPLVDAALGDGRLPSWVNVVADRQHRDQLRTQFAGSHDIAGAAEALCAGQSITYDQSSADQLGNMVFNAGFGNKTEVLNAVQLTVQQPFYWASGLYGIRMNCYDFVNLAGLVANDADARPIFNFTTNTVIDESTIQVWDGKSEIPRGKVIIGCVDGRLDRWWIEGEGPNGEYHFGVSLGDGKVASNHGEGPQIESLSSVFGGWFGYDRVIYGDYKGFSQRRPDETPPEPATKPSPLTSTQVRVRKAATTSAEAIALALIGILVFLFLFGGGGKSDNADAQTSSSNGDSRAAAVAPIALAATATPQPTDTPQPATPQAAATTASIVSQPAGNTPQTAPVPTQPATGAFVPLGQQALQSIAFNNQQFASFFGPCAFQQNVMNGTDLGQSVASSPEMVQAVNAAGLTGFYNAARSTAACNPFTVQNLVATGDPAKLGALYQRYREVYPTLFTNLTDLGAIGAYDAPSFCQYGVFPSNNTSFIFCAMQKGNYFGTVAVGFPPPNAAPPGSTVNVDAYMQLVRDYAQRVDAMLAAQGLPVAPQPVATATPAPSAPDLIRAALAGEYTQAIRSSNAGYLVAHLHPIGIQFYGLAKCQQYFPQVAPDPTFAIEVLSISAPGPFTWTIYGETVGTAQNIYTAHVRLTQRGTTVEADAHFGWDAQQGLQLFSPCRSP